jgi:hypothetical protein
MPRISYPKPGELVIVTTGTDEGKIAKVVPMSLVPRSNRGVPMLGRGHYNPVQRTDLAIMYIDDRTLDVYDRYLLKRFVGLTLSELEIHKCGLRNKKVLADYLRCM